MSANNVSNMAKQKEDVMFLFSANFVLLFSFSFYDCLLFALPRRVLREQFSRGDRAWLRSRERPAGEELIGGSS